jgi:hypothetical protein
VNGDDLIVRLDPQESDTALEDPNARPFDMTGRPMRGWLLVQVESDEQLRSWVKRAADFAASLEPKS